ncbi:molybdate ABC transporter substrate-binding protein [Motiliproteus sediminis]|uniref:molybdate ABC transporter substrate-binding protein n=1 Tax=Motiliproteus sediminis TaxID=1468178 RepID=UPI001AF0272A|nr:molybdate ABC transporter substrate-binding protein [Motiliproteus sediminis]
MLKRGVRGRLWLLLSLCCLSLSTSAANLNVAVAANFIAPMKALVERFQQQGGQPVRVAYGSSGKLYAQIVNGAPFDLLLSADQDKPVRLEAAGVAVAGSRFTYAEGQLVLWSLRFNLPEEPQSLLAGDSYRYLALANPRLAPYGMAAEQVLQRLQLDQLTLSRRVQGENIAQTYQFVASGNAEYGFVALSQVLEQGEIRRGSGWIVPLSLYDPIRQDAVLLNRGADNPQAREFLRFLRSDEARAIIRAHGYRLDP